MSKKVLQNNSRTQLTASLYGIILSKSKDIIQNKNIWVHVRKMVTTAVTQTMILYFHGHTIFHNSFFYPITNDKVLLVSDWPFWLIYSVKIQRKQW